MNIRTTPLGFIPGEVKLNSHCIFVYSEKDEVFIRNIVDYLWAGVVVGELCICITQEPALSMIRHQMSQLGVDPDSGAGSGQLLVTDESMAYIYGEHIDLKATEAFWRDKLSNASEKWRGLRAFVDIGTAPWSRTARLKVLEFESLVNHHFPPSIGMCAYQSDITPRSFLLQAKSVHPYIANCRSIRRNQAFLHPSRFLTGFYRFGKLSKVYGINPTQISLVMEDFDDMSARTPLKLDEILELRDAVGTAFGLMIRGTLSGCADAAPHLHISLSAAQDRFRITMKRHCTFANHEEFDAIITEQLRGDMSHYSLDGLWVGRRNGNIVLSLMKGFPPWPRPRQDRMPNDDNF